MNANIILSEWKMKLECKMAAENCKDYSDDEFERVFSGCVAARRCVEMSKYIFRGENLL